MSANTAAQVESLDVAFRRWFGDMCFGDWFNIYLGGSCDDGYVDGDFDSCP